MKLFFIIALTFFTLVYLFLGFRLTGIGNLSWLLAGVPFFFILSYLLFLRERLKESWDRVLRSFIYFNMGLVSFVLGLLVFREFIYFSLRILAPQVANKALSQEVTLALLLGAIFIFIYGYWNANRGPKIVQISIPIEALPEELQDFSIIHLTDLHMGPGVNAEFVKNVVEMTLSIDANIIVMTGDMADGSFSLYSHLAKPFAKLTQKVPVLYVTGNHEYYKDGKQWVNYFSQLGITPLLNQNIAVPFRGKTILFTGVIDPAAKMVNPQSGPNISQALQGAHPADFKILLAHQPNIATEAAPHFHLQLSGHTHGGQFFPWIYVIGFFQKFPKGLMKSGAMWIYVNVGTGFWGPSLRVGTRSEITQIRLKKA